MIQRIQTIYLFLAALALVVLQRFPYLQIKADEFFTAEYTAMTLLSVIPAVFLGVAIFFFRNRRLQARIANMATLFILAFIGYAGYQLFTTGFEGYEFEWGILLPVAALLFSVVAIRKINADEKLVQSSSSRLR